MGYIDNSFHDFQSEPNTILVLIMLAVNLACIANSYYLHRGKLFAARVLADVCALVAVLSFISELMTMFVSDIRTSLTWLVVVHNIWQISVCVTTISACDMYISYERWCDKCVACVCVWPCDSC